ncbi:MAG: hypothetical protein RSE17_04065 [Bacilli bacterium]
MNINLIKFRRITYIIIITISICITSFYIIRHRAFNNIYKYIHSQNLDTRIIQTKKGSYILKSLESADFFLECKIKDKPEKNKYYFLCNGINKKVTVIEVSSDGLFNKNPDLK